MTVKNRKTFLKVSLSLYILLALFLIVPDVFAEEGPSSGRVIWDNVMLVINFLILVFFFMKYAKKPLMNFLRGVRTKIEENLNEIDGRMQDAQTERDREADKIKGLDQYIEEIRTSIMEMGEKEKEMIIEQGRASAEKMINDAKAYADHRITVAKKALSEEMVDLAISIVEEKLALSLNDDDNEKLIDQFVTDLETAKI